MHVARVTGGGLSDHFLLVAKMKWGEVGLRRNKEQVQYRVVIKLSELSKKVQEQEYVDKSWIAYEKIEYLKIKSV